MTHAYALEKDGRCASLEFPVSSPDGPIFVDTLEYGFYQVAELPTAAPTDVPTDGAVTSTGGLDDNNHPDAVQGVNPFNPD